MKLHRHILFSLLSFLLLKDGRLCAQSRINDSLQLLLKTDKDDTNKVNHLNLLARNYTNAGHYDTSLVFGKAANELAQKIKFEKGSGNAYNNIGLVYECKGEYTEALKNYNASLEIRKQTGEKRGIATCLINIGNVYRRGKKYSESEKMLEEGLRTALESGSKDVIMNGYHDISKLDSVTRNYTDAYSHFKMYIIYRDSVNNEEVSKKAIHSQMQYYFDKKKTEDSVQHAREHEIKQEEISSQNALVGKEEAFRYVLSGGIVLVLLLSGFLFNRFRMTRNQSRLIANQKKLVDEKQKEIIDSIRYAKRIQESLLPSLRYIERNIDRLNKNN